MEIIVRQPQQENWNALLALCSCDLCDQKDTYCLINRLATYFTNERHKRVSIMPNEATHSSWESCRWPCRVAPSYHRLTSWWLSAPMLMPPASPGPRPVSARKTIISVYLLPKQQTRDAIKMKLCCIIWTSWRTLPAAAAQAPDSSESPAAMKDDSRSFSSYRDEVMNQQRPGKETDTSGCLSKVSCARMRIKFLYSEPRASLSCAEGHLLFTMFSGFFLSFLGLRPTSRVPGHSSVLQHSLIFWMQRRAKPISPQRATRAQLSISSSGTCEHT